MTLYHMYIIIDQLFCFRHFLFRHALNLKLVNSELGRNLVQISISKQNAINTNDFSNHFQHV